MKRSFILLLLIISFGVSPADTMAKEKIIWYQMNIMPAYIPEEPFKNQGLQDPIDQQIKAVLENQGYDVEFRTANMTRIHKELKTGVKAGCGGLLKNDTLDKFIEFSIPHSIALTVRVIIRTEAFEKFKPFIDETGNIDLEDVLTSTSLKLGIASGRPYTGEIDKILQKQAGNKNIISRSGTDISKGLFLMLMTERFDYTILYPWEAKFLKRLLKEKKELISIPVRGMPPYVLVYAGLPKTQWGKEVTAILNPMFLAIRNTPEYHKKKEFWLDENAKKFYRIYVKEYFSTPQN